jgi:hypothetical protein
MANSLDAQLLFLYIKRTLKEVLVNSTAVIYADLTVDPTQINLGGIKDISVVVN